MSDLFMHMHRRRRRWHNKHETSPPPTSATPLSATPSTTTTTSESSPSSAQQTINDHNFSHHRNTTTNGTDASRHANFNFNNQNEGKLKKDKYQNQNDNNVEEQDNDYDELANILSLKLKKPKNWKWELSTSKSCSNIALPRILLYDHKGKLLVDAADDNESVYKQENYERPKRDRSQKRSHESKQSQYSQRSSTTNLTHSIRKALEKEFHGLQIQEATPSPEPCLTPQSSRSHRSRKAIDLNTTDLPDYGLSRRSSSLRGVRFNVEDDLDDDSYYVSQIPEFLPTPPSTTTPTSSSSGPREKRKYRRSHSSGRSSAHSGSILERFSYQKGRFSSPEYAEEKTVEHGPRYFLRTSKAGTLVVQEDSFHLHPRRRRRPTKNRSSESLQSIQKFSALNTPPSSEHLATARSNPTLNQMSLIRQHQPQGIRRRVTDGNLLLNKQLSTSEEDVALAAAAAGQKQLMDNVNSRHLRKYVQARNQTKGLEDYSADVHHNGKVR